MRLEIHGSELAAATAAAALSWVGHQVHWVPHDSLPWPRLLEADWLKREPDLMAGIREGRELGTLTVEGIDSPKPGDINILWLALSPEQRDEAGELVEQAAARHANDMMLVNNSTFPVGETERLETRLGSPKGRSVALVDMLEEGRAWASFTRPGRWLLGCDDDHAEAQVRELLRAFNRRRDVVQRMPRRAAELTKLATIGMLATRISYMNEIAGLADSLGVDVEHVRQGMGADSRIGYEYLYPGCGFGGPNFSRDLMRLANVQEASGRHSALLEQVLDINEQVKETLFRKLWTHFHGRLSGRVWGVEVNPVLTLAPPLQGGDPVAHYRWLQVRHVRKSLVVIPRVCGRREGIATGCRSVGSVLNSSIHYLPSHPPGQESSMAQQSLSFHGVENADQVNRITTALMMLDGVESAEVGRHGADVEGRVSREALIKAVQSLKLPIEVQ
ncbi:UDP-glucose/GDP-mannose dehydrogenase family protein [Halomonas chromatireducens]|uniref:UDP-glucose 6-dehydrogenase n=2 Tax=Halomonas TaxID=2745 RepID=A0A0X8HE13_9GAMM|nr:UDP-glucose/GDP-mannose dehydrogenase family protein [Halomonas chromatireducens]AMD00933.1 UDP-glucose 6-dehydrogenase YwqF [Halomonas chromatireducens]